MKAYAIKAASSVGLVIAIVVCMTMATAKEVEANTGNNFEKNASGITYGSLLDATSEKNSPQLVSAVATNGKEGYVYKSDLDRAEGNWINDPDEAVEFTKLHEENFEKALAQSLSELGCPNPESAAESIAVFINSGKTPTEAIQSISSNVTQNTAALSDSQIMESVNEAIEASSISIPVYEKDGKTVIGEFLVGGI